MSQESKKRGDMVEGYRVEAELGRGAASTIYLVTDPKTRQVWALKHVVKDGPKEQRFLDQAEQEYKIASNLDSPVIRKIDRIIRKKEGILSGVNELYLVMEHVDGASCERSPPRYFEDLANVFEQVAKGLAYMHASGYVHADMKPNNIIVDDNLNAKIIDLGQSCKAGTIKERIQGTPDYIAPEQVHRRAITPKTDVYNLGAAMYFLLTRQFVPTALSKGDSLLGSIDDALLRRPKRAIEINPRVPEGLDAIVMQCVEIEPEMRPDMARVADQLNFIRARLIVEHANRKSGMLPKVETAPDTDPANGSRAGGNGTGSAGGAGGGAGGSGVGMRAQDIGGHRRD